MSDEHKRKISEALNGNVGGDRNGNWRGGRLYDKKNGRVLVHSPDHPNATSKGYVYEHRLIMEKHLGRYLGSDELVHHRDENKDNNDILNLEVMSRSEHMRLHRTKYIGCLVDGCERKHRARKYCAYHYNKFLTEGRFNVPHERTDK